MNLGEIVRHPASIATAITGILGGILHVPLLMSVWSWLVASSGTLFGGLSVFAFTIGPEVSWIDAEALTPVVLVLGAIYGGSKLYRAATKLRDKLP